MRSIFHFFFNQINFLLKINWIKKQTFFLDLTCFLLCLALHFLSFWVPATNVLQFVERENFGVSEYPPLEILAVNLDFALY